MTVEIRLIFVFVRQNKKNPTINLRYPLLLTLLKMKTPLESFLLVFVQTFSPIHDLMSLIQVRILLRAYIVKMKKEKSFVMYTFASLWSESVFC